MFGSMLIGEIEQKTNIRYKNGEYFETFINFIDVDFVTGVVVFSG